MSWSWGFVCCWNFANFPVLRTSASTWIAGRTSWRTLSLMLLKTARMTNSRRCHSSQWTWTCSSVTSKSSSSHASAPSASSCCSLPPLAGLRRILSFTAWLRRLERLTRPCYCSPHTKACHSHSWSRDLSYFHGPIPSWFLQPTKPSCPNLDYRYPQLAFGPNFPARSQSIWTYCFCCWNHHCWITCLLSHSILRLGC